MKRWYEVVAKRSDAIVAQTPGLKSCTVTCDDGNLYWAGKFETAEAAIAFLKKPFLPPCDEASLDFEKLVREWETVGLDGDWPDWYEAAFGTCFCESHYLDDENVYEVVWIDGTPEDHADEVEAGETSQTV